MDYSQIFESFKQKRILIVGDVMVDAYCYGKVNRISPEAPVPIVSFTGKEERLGGAANVALNIASMGAQPILVSLLGEDAAASTLLKLMDENKLAKDGILQANTRTTTIKTRVMGNKQHLLRIDEEDATPITDAEANRLLDVVKLLCDKGIDSIIFEDYNKGVLTPKLIEGIIQLAQKNGIPTAVDPKKDNFFAYQNVTLFKPNLKELKEGLGVDFAVPKGEAFEKAVQLLQDKLNNDVSFITLSEYGVFIASKAEKHYVNAHYRNITDVSGAGDTVISVATLCLAAGLPLEVIARVANMAGGLVCEKTGVVSIDALELLHEMNKHNF